MKLYTMNKILQQESRSCTVDTYNKERVGDMGSRIDYCTRIESAEECGAIRDQSRPDYETEHFVGVLVVATIQASNYFTSNTSRTVHSIACLQCPSVVGHCLPRPFNRAHRWRLCLSINNCIVVQYPMTHICFSRQFLRIPTAAVRCTVYLSCVSHPSLQKDSINPYTISSCLQTIYLLTTLQTKVMAPSSYRFTHRPTLELRTAAATTA